MTKAIREPHDPSGAASRTVAEGILGRASRLARVCAAIALMILLAGVQSPARAINITVDGVLYDLTVNQSTFNANRVTLESQPWWQVGDAPFFDSGARADDFIAAYLAVGTDTSTDFGFANINFGYAEISGLIRTRQLNNIGETSTAAISPSSNIVPWAQVSNLGAAPTPIPEINGAALGQVLFILGALYLSLRNRWSRRVARV